MTALAALAIILLVVVVYGLYAVNKKLDRLAVEVGFNRMKSAEEADYTVRNVADSRDKIIARLEQ